MEYLQNTIVIQKQKSNFYKIFCIFIIFFVSFVSNTWANDSLVPLKNDNDLGKAFIQGTEPPNPDINFYACEFHHVQTFNELIEQFYFNLGGDCLKKISTEKLANSLGVSITDKRMRTTSFIYVENNHMKDIKITRSNSGFSITATEHYFKENYSLFPNNILPKNIQKPAVWVQSRRGVVQSSDYMRGDLLNLPYAASYGWFPVQLGNYIGFYNWGNNSIRVVNVYLDRLNVWGKD